MDTNGHVYERSEWYDISRWGGGRSSADVMVGRKGSGEAVGKKGEDGILAAYRSEVWRFYSCLFVSIRG
jgi:hypothetical protein